jgi:membrane peptidoglycan carboxypeptidase
MVDPRWGPVERDPQNTGARPRRAKGGPPPSPDRPPGRLNSWLAWTGMALGALILLGTVGTTTTMLMGYASTNVPEPNAEFKTATTLVYYSDGKTELGSFAIQNRQPITLKRMPDNIKQAVVSAENRSFWTDKGVSVRGMTRAGWTILRGGTLQGGSTITQQYIKVLYLNSEQTLARKFKEVFLAYKINKQLSKDQILEGYLNTIYFGHGAYGIQAASKAYFDVDAKELSVPQAAFLAAVINNPAALDPADEDNLPRLQERYAYVIMSMAETGAITPEEAVKYSSKLPKFPDVPANQRYGGPKGFLLKMVERELATADIDASRVHGGGLKIVTTFDKDAQDAAIEASQKHTKEAADASGEKASKLHAAIASVDVGSGEVIALYGGPDFVKSSRNWATTARPTASTFKTYAVAAAIKDGFSLNTRLNGNTFTPPGESTPVRNEYSYQYGPAVTLTKATTDSINTAFVDLTTKMENGPQKIIKMAQAAGAPKGAGWDKTSRLPLGTAEVSPLAQAGAYATFANDGTYVANHVVKEVRDPKKKVIYEADPEHRRAVSEDISHDVTYALSNVVEEGTGRAVATLNRPVAGKTGTKDRENADGSGDIVSAWFVAYTKQISTAVMYVAGNDGNGDLDEFRRPGDPTFFGGTYPALTWADYMAKATEGQPIKQFAPPAYVNKDKFPAPVQTRTSQPTWRSEPTEEPTSSPTETQDPTETQGPTETQDPTEPAKKGREPKPTSPTTTASSVPSTSQPTGGKTKDGRGSGPPGRG